MSHQGLPGWFPECVVCGDGNVGPVVCLDPTCHETRGRVPIRLEPTKYVHGDLVVDEKLVEEGGHVWKCCQVCDRRIHADGGAFGVYAICVSCFNLYAEADRDPPASPRETQRDLESGVAFRSEGKINVRRAR